MFGLLLAWDAEALRVGHRKLATETAGEGRTAGPGGARVKENDNTPPPPNLIFENSPDFVFFALFILYFRF
jgi:hypothetical protein